MQYIECEHLPTFFRLFVVACVLDVIALSIIKSCISIRKNLWFTNSKLISAFTTSYKQMLVDSIIAYESYPAALCDNPVDIDNGMATFTRNSIGDVVTYTCNVGFELIGIETATCTLVDMDSAEFQPAPPSCRREFFVEASVLAISAIILYISLHIISSEESVVYNF